MRVRIGMAAICSAVMAGVAWAAEPEPGQVGLQSAATPVMEQIIWFHNGWLMPLITVISVLVLALLAWVIFKFNKRSNPEPRSFSHNTTVEVLWTVVPVLILVVISVPSFRLLYLQDRIPEADLTVKAIGYQWYWGYEYPDLGEFEIISVMLDKDQAEAAGKPHKLAVDNALVVPAGKTVKVLVTAQDVIHNWAMPAFGIKMDAIPGRLNETWFRVDEPGTYYGQCSEICGANHAFMPIEVRVLPEDEYELWAEEQKAVYAAANQPSGASFAQALN
ncbi:MAG: cytochrome c oxidase subunit II [Maricaulaceae bacterium]